MTLFLQKNSKDINIIFQNGSDILKLNVYIDLIFIQNIVINYILLTQTEILLTKKTSKTKKILASTVGAIYVVIMIIFKLSILNYIIAKFFLVIIIVYISFIPKDIKMFFKQIYLFLIISIINVGTVNILKQILNIKSKEIYLEIIIYILSFIISKKIALKTWTLYKHRLKSNNLIYDVKIKLNISTLNYTAFLDTGNTVTSRRKNVVFVRDDIALEKEKNKLKSFDVIVKTISADKTYKAYIPKKISIKANKEYINIQNVGIVFLDNRMFVNKEYNMILNNNIFEEVLGGISI